MNHSTLAKNAWLFLEFYLLVEEDYFSLFQLQLEISELKEKMKHLEHQELQKMDNGPSQQMIEELLQKLSSLERDLEVEKEEKGNIILEIVNLQEVLKKKEIEMQMCEENLKDKMKHLEHQELQRMDNDPSQQMIVELLQKVSSLERDLDVAKGEKESIIHEMFHLQEVLEKKEEEMQMCEENLKAAQDALSNEKADREALGKQARQKLQEHEENEHKLALKVKKLTREVKRWKKEVDMHVEAENRKEEESTPTPAEKQEPKTEQHTPSGTFALTLIIGDKKSRQTLRAFSICKNDPTRPFQL